MAECGRRYPSVWARFAEFRKGRGTDLPRWPEWCWCPLAAAYSIVSGGGSNRLTVQGNLMSGEFYQPNSLPTITAKGLDIGILGALAAWRMTQGIYTFDPDFFEALWTTEVGTLPIEIFYNLPEWCLYIEVPQDNPRHAEMLGWFVHLEWDVNTGRTELRLVMDLKDALVPVPIHLTHRTMNLCLKDAAEESMRQAKEHGLDESTVARPRAGSPDRTDHLGDPLSLLHCRRNPGPEEAKGPTRQTPPQEGQGRVQGVSCARAFSLGSGVSDRCIASIGLAEKRGWGRDSCRPTATCSPCALAFLLDGASGQAGATKDSTQMAFTHSCERGGCRGSCPDTAYHSGKS